MIGKRIKELRKSENLTQKQLSEKLGITTSMIGMYETAARNPSYEILNKLSDFFNVSIDFLMGEIPFKNKKEAQHSISIAVIKHLIEDQVEQCEFLELSTGLEIMMDNNFKREILTYCETLFSKFNNNEYLTNIELFELSNIIFKSIKWSIDYDGKVFLEDHLGITCMIELEFEKINRVTLNLEESYLLKISDHDNFNLEQAPTLINLTDYSGSEYNNNNLNLKNNTKYSELLYYLENKDLSEQEIDEIKNYIDYIISKRDI